MGKPDSLDTLVRFTWWFFSTGQRIEDAADLYFYKSRWYDPVAGRFLQADTVVPAPGNPQSLNRYAYVNNNPLRYTDPSGHCPWCVAAGIVILKGIDYGWTAWDTWQAGRILSDPGASTEERLTASLTVALSGLELLEPDDLFPISLPLDDLVRHGITAGFEEAVQRGGLKAGVQHLQGALGKRTPQVIR